MRKTSGGDSTCKNNNNLLYKHTSANAWFQSYRVLKFFLKTDDLLIALKPVEIGKWNLVGFKRWLLRIFWHPTKNFIFIIGVHTGNDLNFLKIKNGTPLRYFKLKIIFKFLVQFVTKNLSCLFFVWGAVFMQKNKTS